MVQQGEPGEEGVEGHHEDDAHDVALEQRLIVVLQVLVDLQPGRIGGRVRRGGAAGGSDGGAGRQDVCGTSVALDRTWNPEMETAEKEATPAMINETAPVGWLYAPSSPEGAGLPPIGSALPG